MAAETILSGLVEKNIEKLGSYASEKIGLVLGMTEELRKLRRKLIMIRSLLLDAEKQQVGNRAVREWMSRLKEVVHDADDVVDRVMTEDLRKQVDIHGSKRREVRFFFTHANPLKFRYGIGLKIKDIRERVDEIVTDMRDFGFVVRVLDRDRQVERRVRKETSSSSYSYSSVPSSDVVGRDTDKADILEKIRQPSPQGQNVSVIPIVGMGGLGKTTLARSVYDEFNAKEWVKEWVCVSDDFDIEQIVRQISKDDRETLQSRCQKTLGGKKFLLVLDDVWNENASELGALLKLLEIGASGSKIVVTTRSKKVASIMGRGTVDPHEIKVLSDDDCLKVLLKWAFSEEERKKHPKLIEIGKDIVKKCKGVPLAARTLGCMLYSKTREKDWEVVRDNEIWELPQEENDILPALKLSYDQMPSSSLKQCFAYCSLFPKDEIIYRKDLVSRWMAQGLVESSDKNEELEDIGDMYFDELVSRSFLELEEDRRTESHSHRMHDLVHDLAQLVAESECIIHTSISRIPRISKTIRHASFGWRNSQSQIISPHSLEYTPSVMRWRKFVPTSQDQFLSPLKQKHLTPLHRAKKLRTLCLPPDMDPTLEPSVSTLIPTFKYLRLLDIPYFKMKVLPSSIGNLKHLRYLSLDSNSLIQTLPDSLCKLLNLQTLNLNGCKSLRNLPTDFGNLISLRYLLISSSIECLSEKAIYGLTSLRTLKISSLELTVLPEGIQRLSRLRTLDINECPKLVSLPKGMQCLTTLESLHIGLCDELNILVDDLKGLGHLQDLRLNDLPKLVTLPKGLEDAAATLLRLLIDNCEVW